MHPLGSLPIFALQREPNPEFKQTIAEARDQMLALLPQLKGRIVQLAFRVGQSGQPTARSLRRSIDDVLID